MNLLPYIFGLIYCVMLLSTLDYFNTKSALISVWLVGSAIVAAIITTGISLAYLILAKLAIL